MFCLRISSISKVSVCFTQSICVYNLESVLRSKQLNVGVYKIVQARCKSNVPLPPGLSPFEPKAIPYARPDLQRKGGKFLLVIPIIAFGLGTWQIKRLQWKTNLINDLKEKTLREPVPLPIDPAEVAELEFSKVTVSGTFDHENEFLYGPKPCLVNGEPDPHVVSKTGQSAYGFNLITPFVLSDSGQRILVNRGWIRTSDVKKENRPWSLTTGEQPITGVVRTSEPLPWVAPSSDQKYKIWHVRLIEDMAEENGCLPIFIDATTEHSIPNRLWGGQTRIQLRNEHLSYILTWYALSIATGLMWYVKYVKK